MKEEGGNGHCSEGGFLLKNKKSQRVVENGRVKNAVRS